MPEASMVCAICKCKDDDFTFVLRSAVLTQLYRLWTSVVHIAFVVVFNEKAWQTVRLSCEAWFAVVIVTAIPRLSPSSSINRVQTELAANYSRFHVSLRLQIVTAALALMCTVLLCCLSHTNNNRQQALFLHVWHGRTMSSNFCFNCFCIYDFYWIAS